MQNNEHLDIDREQEAHEYHNAQPINFDLTVTKETIVPNIQTSIETLIQGVEDGDLNALDVFATFKKIEGIFTNAKKKVEEYAHDEADKYEKTFTFSGVTFTKKEGAKRLQFHEDHIISQLSEKIKERQELVKVATNSKDSIFDSEGVEVSKVSIKQDKSSLQVKF
jgi:hypothetical protein